MGSKRTRITSPSAALLSIVAIIATGCDAPRGSPAPKIDFHNVLRWPWVEESKTGTPGIDYGEIWCAMDRHADDKPLVAIWFDTWPAGQQIGRSRGTLAASEHKQPIRFDNGKVVIVEYRTEAGQEGILDFRIDGKEYNLDSGRLFLITIRGEAPRALQLKRELGPDGMQFDAGSIGETAQADTEIRGFFTAAAAN